MKTETLYDGRTLDKIGFGTWTVGGRTSADPSQDQRSLAALRSAVEIGYRHFDTAEYYAAGNSERLVGQAMRESGIPRDEFFVTTKVQPSNLGAASTRRAFERSLVNLGMDYIDLYLIHWPRSNMPLEETIQTFNEFVAEGRLRYIGVSNFSVDEMKRAATYADQPLLTNQVPYSVDKREYVENGVLDYCQQNDILLTAYSPVKEGRLRSNEVLEVVARAHSATIYQIALAWVVQQPNVITIPLSFNPQHQRENFAAADIELTAEEMARLDALA